MNREPGYYWVKIKHIAELKPAKWANEMFAIGTVLFREKDIEKVYPNRILPPDQVRGEETNEDWIVDEAKLYLKELQLRNTQDPVDVEEMFINDFAVFGKRIKSALAVQPRPSDSGTANLEGLGYSFETGN